LALDGSALSHAALQIVRNRGFRMKPNQGDTRTSTVIFEALYGRITTRRYVDVESISSVCSIRILSTMHRLDLHGEARTPVSWRMLFRDSKKPWLIDAWQWIAFMQMVIVLSQFPESVW
jgi:hypothetical protein